MAAFATMYMIAAVGFSVHYGKDSMQSMIDRKNMPGYK